MDPPGNPSGLVYDGRMECRCFLVLTLGLWLCVVIDSFVVGVENLLFGYDYLERPHLDQLNVNSHPRRVFKFSLRFWMILVRSCHGVKEYFDALGNCDNHTIQYRTLSSPFVDSVLIILQVNLTGDATPASFTAPISTPFSLYHLQSSVKLEDPMWLIVLLVWFNWWIFDLYRLLVYSTGSLTMRAAACSSDNEVAWFARFCNSAALLLLNYARILCLMDRNCLLTKIPLSKFSS